MDGQTEAVAVEVPAWIADRHHQLNVAARECYGLRDVAAAEGFVAEAILCGHEGDRYFAGALALSAEWDGAVVVVSADRGNWPRWYGVCRLSDGARSDIARWAFYSIGARMTAREHATPRTVERVPAVPDSPHCAICGQLHGLTMAELVEQDTSLPVYCSDCESRICDDHGHLDCARCSATAGPQGESVRLFEPAPSQLPGQLAL